MRKLLIFLLLITVFLMPVQAQDAATDLMGRINNLRTSLGLSPYSYNGALALAAQGHAQYMVDTGTVSHTQTNGSTPSSRAAAAGYPSSFVSENIYGGTNATANDAWSFWMNSPIHYRGITNSGYTEIGIGVASGSWGRAFVLVFGSQANPYIPQASGGQDSTGGGNGSAPQAPPSFIVGQDNVGNIMHEIQPGQTIGDIALLYGHGWDDIPYMLQINGLTEQDIRLLKEGEVFLVPPHSGTFTPTPLPEGWPTPTPYVEPTVDNSAPVWTAIAQQGLFSLTLTQVPISTLMPTLTPIATNSETPVTEANNSLPIATSNTIPAFLTVATATTEPPSTAEVVAMVSTPSTENEPTQVVIIRDNTSQWVVAAVVLQSLVIIGASIEFIRRSRRK